MSIRLLQTGFMAILAIPCIDTHAGPYSPPAGTEGSEAIHMDLTLFTGWAVGWTNYQVGAETDPTWQTPMNALGKAEGSFSNIVSLGAGGSITMIFDPPITDGPGPDFAVFENSINHTFLELAFVEVSADGTNFHRFPSHSLTPSLVPSFGSIDARDISGLAGTFIQGFGTPFDIAELPPTPEYNLNQVRWVRLIDIIGDGPTLDSLGNKIFDPTPTVQSAGFDLDAIGVIHFALMTELTADRNDVRVLFDAPTNRMYHVEFTSDLTQPDQWTIISEFIYGDNASHSMIHENPFAGAGAYRVVINLLSSL